MHKYLKIFITFLLIFNFSVVYAENETEENVTEENIAETYNNETEVINATVTDINTNPRQIKELINGNYLVIEDDANLLNENELFLLKNNMQPLTEYGNIIFKTIETNNTDTYSYAANYYYNNFGNGSGTMFIIDMQNRYIYVISEGWNYTIITDRKAEIITDNAYYYAKNGLYYQCATKVFDQVNTLLKGGKINEPMRHISNVVVSLVSGFFVAFIYVLNKTKIKQPKGSEILKDCDIEFTVNSINAQKSGTHKVYSPRSDSSSSGGGGGHSGGGGGGFSGGGGGFSGGGGGHRF